jgi:hypothetical protein
MPTPIAVAEANKRVAAYLKKFAYSRCLIVGNERWHEQLAARLKLKFKGKVSVRFQKEQELDKHAILRIMKALK